MTPKQCKMARAGLGWTVSDLSKKSGSRAATISNFERGGDALKSTVEALKDALLSSGEIRFEGETGVFIIIDEAHKAN
ncbi:helix-turn-helix domain-containing protein [Agarilytica rhodophyticola]|uniref:helix-turn-helix domain-containing protein n=1 Tax=Agarilytica rhodophyticola TaxID=1737490 RepID=UPI000B344674|nr:helix-turn-helix domain-containing protein [Agarilytica rhodophyticola]